VSREPIVSGCLLRFGVSGLHCRAIVAGEEDERILCNTEFIKQIENAARAGVEFLNAVAIDAVPRFSGERG